LAEDNLALAKGIDDDLCRELVDSKRLSLVGSAC